MATGDKAAWQVMQSKLQALGRASAVVIGEPRECQDGLVAIIPDDGEVEETTLSSPRERHRVVLRKHRTWLGEPPEEIEFDLDQFRAEIQADVFGDFDLGGNVAYALPDEFRWRFDKQTVNTIVYRTIDLTVGYRVDDNAIFGR